ncbi:MAG TPA: NADH-quinone oxidoreductase subunit L, partial [Acidimicrobiaceae bacterium]|nr:NADH-quinone oxidoreductase subunit L [Acidimicrobiaceae bacterium]
MVELVWLVPALPLAGFAVLAAFGRRLGEPRAGWIGTAASAGAFVVAVVVFAGLLGRPAATVGGAAGNGGRSFTQTLFEWLPSGTLQVDAAFLVDALSATMALFVTGVGTLIHLYSVGYMHGDPRYSKFFAYLNLFLFSMLVLVLADNLVLTFLGWEGVGTCSYLLISFWHERPAAATAGKKAFITNRVGDFGYMLAVFLVWTALGTVDYAGIAAAADGLAGTTATAVSLLLLLAAAGKSAQLPLYVWLPDAMEGPTPVSAMVHAATMVTAGVYLLVRMNPVLTDDALLVIAVVGAATALFAALAAAAQHDIKRLLAYSTISQLGYMFLAVGSGAYVAAIFHVVTHAFFKGLLFLGAGSVIHGMGDRQDMRSMGALRAVMPITAGTFIVGWLAIAGVPPFSGFWSKDEILLAAWEQPQIGPLLWAVGLATALLTAYYMSRQTFLVFFGTARWDAPPAAAAPDGELDAAPDGEPDAAAAPGTPAAAAAPHESPAAPHESPATMTVPLVLLAVGAAVAGVVNLPLVGDWLVLEHFLEPVLAHPLRLESGTGAKLALAVVAGAAALAGIAVAAAAWLRGRIPTTHLEPDVLRNALYVDAAVSRVVAGPGTAAFAAAA